MANRVLIGNRAAGQTTGYGAFVSKTGANVLNCDDVDLIFNSRVTDTTSGIFDQNGMAFDVYASGSVNIFGESEDTDPTVIDQIFRHFIFGVEVDIAKPISIRLGYNHQMRQELSLPSKKGISGITVGTGIHIKQFSIDYGFAKYHSAANIHHLGITVNLDEFLGKKSKTNDEKLNPKELLNKEEIIDEN